MKQSGWQGLLVAVIATAAVGTVLRPAIPERSSDSTVATPRVSPIAPQASESSSPPAETRPPALLARASGNAPAQPLDIARLEIKATIEGFLARTSMVLSFRNDLDRPLEGELVFPLPGGSTVSGFGLDVGGELVDGAIVEQKHARITFEKEVRKGIDPGLLEWVRGNVFRMRVWPIPARGQRTVKVEYVSELTTRRDGDRLAALHRIPLRFSERIPEVVVRVEVAKGEAKPEVRGGDLANLHFDRWEELWVAETRMQDCRPKDDLVVALPEVPRKNAVVEKMDDGSFYFAIDDFPPLPSSGAITPARPQRVLLLWDASLSRSATDHSRELALLTAWLRQVADVEVDVVVFRNVPEPSRSFTTRNGDSRALVTFLGKEVHDGGTDLSAALDQAGKSALTRTGYSLAFLVSDGLNTLGAGAPRVPAFPLFSLSANPLADHALLLSLAESSGGSHFDLTTVGVDQALAAIGADALSFRRAESVEGQIADVFPQGRRAVTGRFTVCGRLLTPEATITLHYVGAGASADRTYTIRQTGATASGLVPRLWAQARVEQLQVDPESNREELLELGRRFGIVTPGTSLLVLETLEQHLEHHIEPPRSRTRMRAEYLRRVETEKQISKRTQEHKLAQVAEMWERRVAWWEQEFKYDPSLRLRPRKGTPAERLRQLGYVGDVESEEAEIEGGVAGGVEGGVPGGIVGGDAAPVAVPERRTESRQAEALPAAPPPAPAAGRLARGRASSSDESKTKTEVERQPSPSGPVIAVKPWDPETPYLKKLQAAGVTGAYAAYLEERASYAMSPAFYLDCADHLLRNGRRAEGLRALTSVLDLKLEDARLLRVAGHRLQQTDELGLAVPVFEKVLRLRPEEPQSLRDLALALAARGEAAPRRGDRLVASAREDLRRAVRLLYDVVLGQWDGRFPEVEMVALMDMNRLIVLLDADGRSADLIDLVDPRLRRSLDVDLRVVMTWDTDQSDMDLWVIEPSGERCWYSHSLTAIGGMISRDFTGGYGPEEYLVRRAMPGAYTVKANYFGSREPSLVGPTTVQVTVYTDFGRVSQRRESMALRLIGTRDVVEVGKARFSGSKTGR